MPNDTPNNSRRALLFGAGALAATGAIAFAFRRDVARITGLETPQTYPALSYSFEDSSACLVTAQAVEGPYYIAQALVRRDVREDRQGQTLRLKMKIVDGANCAPLPGAAVDLWHCDALGNYSAAPQLGREQRDADGHLQASNADRFLRGRQIADANGMIEFVTIYPGWYRGRCPHIHLKVFVNESEAATAQLFFTDEQSAEIYAGAPYSQKGLPDTKNADDRVLYDAGGSTGGWPKMSRAGEELVGTLTLGVKRA